MFNFIKKMFTKKDVSEQLNVEKNDINTLENVSEYSNELLSLVQQEPMGIKTKESAEKLINLMWANSEIERLKKIQMRTKKQRTKRKLQKRINTYGK